MKTAQVKRIKELKKENSHLNKAVAELTLDSYTEYQGSVFHYQLNNALILPDLTKHILPHIFSFRPNHQAPKKKKISDSRPLKRFAASINMVSFTSCISKDHLM